MRARYFNGPFSPERVKENPSLHHLPGAGCDEQMGFYCIINVEIRSEFCNSCGLYFMITPFLSAAF
jgi:hypothetical protein